MSDPRNGTYRDLDGYPDAEIEFHPDGSFTITYQYENGSYAGKNTYRASAVLDCYEKKVVV